MASSTQDIETQPKATPGAIDPKNASVAPAEMVGAVVENKDSKKGGRTPPRAGPGKAPLLPKAAQLSDLAFSKTGNKAKLSIPMKIAKSKAPAAKMPGDVKIMSKNNHGAADEDGGGGAGGDPPAPKEFSTVQACLINLLKSNKGSVALHQIAENAPKEAKGLAKVFSDNFEQADCYEDTQARKLGKAIVRKVQVTDNVGNWIIALVAQKYPGKPNNEDDTADMRREWLEKATKDAAGWINKNTDNCKLRAVWVPEKIGAGLAGGSKDKNKEIISRVKTTSASRILWCWVKEPNLLEVHNNVVNKEEVSHSRENTKKEGIQEVIKQEHITDEVDANEEMDDEGDDFSVDQLLLDDAIQEAIEQDQAVLPPVQKEQSFRSCKDEDDNRDRAVVPDVLKLSLIDNEKISDEKKEVLRDRLKADNGQPYVGADIAQVVWPDTGNTDGNGPFSSTEITLEEWIKKYGANEPGKKLTTAQLEAIGRGVIPGGSSKKTGVTDQNTSAKDGKVKKAKAKKETVKVSKQKDIKLRSVEDQMILREMQRREQDEVDKARLEKLCNNSNTIKGDANAFNNAEINKMVENFRDSLQAQKVADLQSVESLEETVKRVQLLERLEREQKVGKKKFGTLYDDIPDEEMDHRIVSDSESDMLPDYFKPKKEKVVIRMPAAKMPGAVGNHDTHRGSVKDKPNFDPYGNIPWIKSSRDLLPAYKGTSKASILEEMRDGGATTKSLALIVAKGPLTDLVWLFTQNESIRLYVLKIQLGNEKLIHSLITRAYSREIICLVHDMELYLGMGYSVNTCITDVCKTPETRDWFENAALPMMRQTMITPQTKQAAYNLKLAADANRFGHQWMEQGQIDNFWQEIVPDPSQENMSAASSHVMYAVISCLATGCSPRMMGRKIYLNKLKKDKEWKSAADKWDVKVMEEDSSSAYRQHPYISESQLKTICDSMAAKVKKVTKLDNIAGMQLQDHAKLVIEMSIKKIINTLQYEALKDNDMSSADPTAASFDKVAATQLMSRLGLFASYLMVVISLFKEADNHDVVISIKNGFANNNIFRMQGATDKQRLAALQVLTYVTRDRVKSEKFDNWTSTSERNNFLRDCFSQAKKLLLDGGVINQTDYDKLPDTKFVISDDKDTDKNKQGNKVQSKNKDGSDNVIGSNTDKKKSNREWKKQDWNDYSHKAKNYKDRMENKDWFWDYKTKSWEKKKNKKANKRARSEDADSPVAKKLKVDGESEDKKGEDQIKDSDKIGKWNNHCAKEYQKLSKDEQKKLATEGIKQGSKPDRIDAPGVCLKGLLGKCGNKDCKRRCKSFLQFCGKEE